MAVDNYRQAFKSAIARIYHTSGAVVGAGFLVSDRLLLTCAHVMTAALGIPVNTAEAPTDAIDVDFPLIAPDLKVKAKVVFWSGVDPLQKKAGEDIAGLELESQPLHSQPVRFVQGDSVWNHPFHIFGFPSQRDAGIWASGVLRDRLANGWVQLEDIKAQGYAVEPGFSGAPVWDEQLDGVVGMAIAAERKRTDAKAAFMIPISVLCDTWKQITSVDQHSSIPTQLNRVQQIRVKALDGRLKSLVEDAEAAHNQLNYTLSEVDCNRIKRQIAVLDQEMNQVAVELDALMSDWIEGKPV